MNNAEEGGLPRRRGWRERGVVAAMFLGLGGAFGGAACDDSGTSDAPGGEGGQGAGDGGTSGGSANAGSAGAGGGGSGGGSGGTGGSGGPEACPVDCDGPCWGFTCTEEQRPVPDTDGAECLDAEGGSTCPSSSDDRYGQDGNYSFPASEFTDGNATYRVDAVTGLVWTVALSGEVTHAEALAHCEELAQAEVAGFDDWRLPTLRELYGTLQPGLTAGGVGSTHQNLGQPAANSIVWSSTLVADSSDEAFGVSSNWAVMLTCPTSGDENYEAHTARCVAGAPASGPWPALTATDEVVVAPSTGLIWQRHPAGEGTWTSALATCEALVLDGESDWRLPEARELASLLQQAPGGVLTGLPSWTADDDASGYWSSSAATAFSQEVYYATADGRLELAHSADLEFTVRCVRKP